MGPPTSPPCPRCYSQEPVLRPWAGFRYVRVVWLGGLCGIVAFAPILASDIFVMIPLSVIYLFAGGPVMRLARLKPQCAACGLERPKPGWHETPCRPVRALPSSHLERALAHHESAEDETSGVHFISRFRAQNEEES